MEVFVSTCTVHCSSSILFLKQLYLPFQFLLTGIILAFHLEVVSSVFNSVVQKTRPRKLWGNKTKYAAGTHLIMELTL